MDTPRTTLLAIVVAGLFLAAGSSGATTSAAPRVTLVADSVGGVLFWQREARDELARGIDLRIDIRTCRRLATEGCVYDGGRPPSALEAIQALGPAVGPLAVVDVGYNDSPAGYGAALDRVMRALLDTGVERVVWVTLRERRPSWAEINDAIRAGARRWPQISVGEWDRESVGHDEWFADGIHMNWDGGTGFARFLRALVLDACTAACGPGDGVLVVRGRVCGGRVWAPGTSAGSRRAAAPRRIGGRSSGSRGRSTSARTGRSGGDRARAGRSSSPPPSSTRPACGTGEWSSSVSAARAGDATQPRRARWQTASTLLPSGSSTNAP